MRLAAVVTCAPVNTGQHLLYPFSHPFFCAEVVLELCSQLAVPDNVNKEVVGIHEPRWLGVFSKIKGAELTLYSALWYRFLEVDQEANCLDNI